MRILKIFSVLFYGYVGGCSGGSAVKDGAAPDGNNARHDRQNQNGSDGIPDVKTNTSDPPPRDGSTHDAHRYCSLHRDCGPPTTSDAGASDMLTIDASSPDAATPDIGLIFDGTTDHGTCLPSGWRPTAVEGAPSERYLHTAVWTDSEMIIWGGVSSDEPPYLDTGGRYNPSTDSWTSTSLADAPFGRFGYHTAVWTGSEMIVWGGWDARGPAAIGTNEGGRYNPLTDAWAPTSTEGAPLPRSAHVAVWTGSEMVVWGGFDYHYELPTPWYEILNDGGRYDPETGAWAALPSDGTPTARLAHSAVWSGSEMVVWGGFSDETTGSPLNTGGRYSPSADMWSSTATAGAPLLYDSAIPIAAVWTGSEMVVWGGDSADGMTNIGGRYNPTDDEWSATLLLDAPTPRRLHTAVWTGTEIIVWGGSEAGGTTNTGGRYDPITDSWTETTTVDTAARSFHTAVWTGCVMIVWGGGTNTGGRYTP